MRPGVHAVLNPSACRGVYAAALLFFTVAGCNNDAAQTGFGSGPTGAAETGDVGGSSSTGSTSSTGSVGSTGSTSSTDSTSSSDAGTSAPWPDAGVPPDFGSLQPEGCKGKIDFLFVISRLHTMDPEQQRLLDSFDGFIATIQEDFADFDSHIMVANPDGKWTGTVCESQACPKYGNCGPNGQDYVCGSSYDSLCDIELGAGLLFNAGEYATNYKCELAGGRRYIVTKEEPNLVEQFKCIARVGTSGPDTPMMKAISAAVAPEINAEGGCNAGFLRPDALLVIVMIMDTADVLSFGGPEKWFNLVVASKGGDTDAIVMVAIIPPFPEEPPDPTCTYEIGPPSKLRLFAEMFPHRVMGNTCAENYAPALAEAAEVVKSTCGSFIPQ